jgi:hypothetical protein
MVIRIDGRLDLATEGQLFSDVSGFVTDGLSRAVISGVEIDYDCPTFRLPVYAKFLRRLREAIPDGTMLSMTVLPTWMGSKHLPELLSIVDESTLQVHAVDSPNQQLFNPRKAINWATRFSGYHRPFRVALPDYGVRVSWDENGGALIESERNLMATGADAQELIADPLDVMNVLRSLPKAGGPNLRGVSWFRLPTQVDERAWSLTTLRSVIRANYISGKIVTTLRPNLRGFQEIILGNIGPNDALLPTRVAVPSPCFIGDGTNGYSWAVETDGSFTLRTSLGGIIHAGSLRVIGWARCTKGGDSDAM